MEFLKIWEILVRRKWLIAVVFFIFFLIGVIGTNFAVPVYKAKTRVLIETPDALMFLKSSLGMQSSSKPAASTSSSDSYDTDIALVQVRPMLESLIDSLKLKDRSGNPLDPEKLVSRSLIDRVFPVPFIRINQHKETSIIEMLAFSTNPSEAANMANKLSELYIKNRIDMTRDEFTAAKLAIEHRIQKVREGYLKSLYAMKDFRLGHGVVDPSSESQTLMSKITGLRSSYEENETLIQRYEVGKSATEQKLKELNMFTKQSEQYTFDLVKSLKSRLNDMLIELSSKSTDITKEHPDYKKMEIQMAAIKELLMNDAKAFMSSESYSVDPRYQSLATRLVEIYIDREVAVAKKSLLKKYLEGYEAELLKIPAKSVETVRLELDINVSRSIYQKMLEFLTHAGVAESITLSKIKVVDPAVVPYKAEYPKKTRNYIISILLGLFWGVVLAFFAEYIDNTIKSPSEIKESTSLTALGVIPRMQQFENNGVISGAELDFDAEEAFRTLKNNILFMSAERPVKTILVTSSLKSEGKSSVASNLAIAFSMDGVKVAILDLNLREPALHKYFKISGGRGLTDSLSRQTALHDIVVSGSVKGVDLLLSGTFNPEPGRLIDSTELKHIIDSLQNAYDRIIIDTPPVLAVNDAVVIGRHTDGVLYVIEYGSTTKPVIEESLEILKKARVNILGFVLNKFIK